jgi:hypothetical protein
VGPRFVAACAASLVLCSAAAGALPRSGVLVPGRSLGGVRLGERAGDVRAALGGAYGTCRSCATTTWYFTYHRFDRRGLAVELTQGRVSAVYTLWRPTGWHDTRGLRFGAVEDQVTNVAGPLVPIACAGYDALVRDRRAGRTVYYVVDGRLWGFGLLRPYAYPCR